MKRKGFYYQNREMRRKNKNIRQIKFGKPTKIWDEKEKTITDLIKDDNQ